MNSNMLKVTVYLNKNYVWYSSPDRIGINIARQINTVVQEWCLDTEPPTGEKLSVTLEEMEASDGD